MRILGVGTAFPKTEFSSQVIAEWTGASEEYITERVGISTRRFLQEDERGIDLALSACHSLKDQHPKLDLHDVELLVYVTQTPDQPLPHMSAKLQAELKLKNIPAFDLSLGCSGYNVCFGYNCFNDEFNGFENALLVTCDPYSKIMSRSDRATMRLRRWCNCQLD